MLPLTRLKEYQCKMPEGLNPGKGRKKGSCNYSNFVFENIDSQHGEK